MLVVPGRKNMLIALLGSAILSFAPLIYILTETNPITGAFFRMLYALPILGIIVYFSRAIDTRDFRSRQLTFIAGLFLALDFLAYHTAIDYIGTGIATMIGNSQVIIVTLISWKFLGEKPNKSILIVLPIVILGLVLISGIWGNEAYGENPSLGVLGGIFAAIFYSSFLIIYRYSNKEKSPAQNLQLDTTAGAAVGLFILGILPLQFINVEPLNIQPSYPSHAWLILLALSCQVLGWIAITYALPRLPAAHTSFALLLQPVLTILWGILLLSEKPSFQQSSGMLLILGSIITVTLFGNAEVTTEK